MAGGILSDAESHAAFHQAIDRIEKTVEKLDGLFREDLREFNTRIASLEARLVGVERVQEERLRSEGRIEQYVMLQTSRRSWVTNLIFGVIGAFLAFVGLIFGAHSSWLRK